MKKRFAQKIKVAYWLGRNLDCEVVNFTTSFDEYIDKARNSGYDIIDDTKAEVIRAIAENCNAEEVLEIADFIEYLKKGGMAELKYERQEVINNQIAAPVCADCQGEGGRRVGMACAACGKVSVK